MINSTPQTSAPDPDTNQIFAILSDPRRRVVLQILERESSIELPELATRVARREGGEGEITDIAVQKVRMDLYHCHLPKIADAGFVEYSPDSDTVTLSHDFGDEVPAQLTALE